MTLPLAFACPSLRSRLRGFTQVARCTLPQHIACHHRQQRTCQSCAARTCGSLPVGDALPSMAHCRLVGACLATSLDSTMSAALASLATGVLASLARRRLIAACLGTSPATTVSDALANLAQCRLVAACLGTSLACHQRERCTCPPSPPPT